MGAVAHALLRHSQGLCRTRSSTSIEPARLVALRWGPAVAGPARSPSVPTERRLSTAATAQDKHAKQEKEQFNEPGGFLFNKVPGEKKKTDWALQLYIWGYLGGTAVFLFLYQYKPDTNPSTWAKEEAQRRMVARGVNIDEYRYKLPQVYALDPEE